MSVIDIIDIAERVIVERWLRSFDTIEATLDAKYARSVVRGDFLYLPQLDFSTPLAFRVTAIDRTKKGASHKVVLHGATLDQRALGGRRCWPSPADYPADTSAEGYDVLSAVPAETALKHFVDANAGAGAVASRQVPGFTVATDAGRGPDVDAAARYQLVVDVAKEICFAADLGWRVYSPTGADHVFEVIVPADRSAEVFLDFEFGTINAWAEVETDAEASVAIVAGQGVGEDREVVIRPSVEPEGLERIEAFIDARDVKPGETAILEQRGDALLASAAPTRAVTVEARQEGSFQYPVDYGLGDYITAQDRERDLREVTQVIGVRITTDKSASVPKIEPILGRPDPATEPRASTSFSGGKVDLSGAGGGAEGGAWLYLTTVVAGEPALVWDANDEPVPTFVPNP